MTALIADALFDVFKKDPNWSVFQDGGGERFGDGEGDDRLCPECGELWNFMWMYMWVNHTLSMWANIDSLYCPNDHHWTAVCLPPTDIGESGYSGADWAVS